MKNKTLVLIFFTHFLPFLMVTGQVPFSGVSGLFTSDSKLPEVIVTSPNGGESYGSSDPLTVLWTATDDSFGPTPISIALIIDSGPPVTIASNLPNAGQAMISPPGAISNYVKVVIYATDTFGNEGIDESDGHFTFDESFSGVSGIFTGDSKPPDVTVISPNGSELIGYVDPFNVTWSATDESFGPEPISIALSLGSGATLILGSGLPNNGQATVIAPGMISDSAKIIVFATDTFGNKGSDESDNFFSFTGSFSGVSALFIADSKPPDVNLISPNGGESFYYDDPLLIKWDAIDDSFGSNPISIQFSTDGGNSYNPIALELPDIDSAFVTAPQVITDSVKIKVMVQDEFGLMASDESDDIFSLLGTYIRLKALLEGPFNGTEMTIFLNFFGQIPLDQPFNQPPWNYLGTENVSQIPNSDVVDWVQVEIRDAANATSATSSHIIGQQAGFIKKDGTIVGLDGLSDIQFGTQPSQNLFAVVHHRNHLPVMSAFPLDVNGNIFSYDFTDAVDKVFGGNNGHKELTPGTWGMIGGDGNADGQVNNHDKNNVWIPQSGLFGYKSGDFTMNVLVNDEDKNTVWGTNAGCSDQVPD